MNTAFAISMLAVGIALFAVFVAVRGSKRVKSKKPDGSDSGTTATSAGSSADCSLGDSGGCDGGGGGGD